MTSNSPLAIALAILLAVPALAAMAHGTGAADAGATDAVVRVERVEESNQTGTSEGDTSTPVNETHDPGREHESSCPIEVAGECFLRLDEEWQNRTWARSNGSSWSWSEARSEATGHRVDALDRTFTLDATTGSRSSQNASGEESHEHHHNSTYYGNNLGFSEAHEDTRKLDAEAEEGASESVRTLRADATLDSPLAAGATFTRERDGSQESRGSESWAASNHSRDALFGVTTFESSDSSSRHAAYETSEAWNRTRVDAHFALTHDELHRELLRIWLERADEQHDRSSTAAHGNSTRRAFLGFPIQDDADRSESATSASGWSRWTRARADAGERLLVADVRYERGAYTLAEDHESATRGGILGIGLEHVVYEESRQEASWRRVDAGATAVEGQAGANASYWDTASDSTYATREEHAFGGQSLAGWGNGTAASSESTGVAVGAFLPDGLLAIEARHENTTTRHTNTTHADLQGSRFFEYTRFDDHSARQTRVAADSAATGSGASVHHVNGTSRTGDVASLQDTPGGATRDREFTNYGAHATLLHGAANLGVDYRDERIVDRIFVEETGGTIDDQYQEFGIGVDGEIETPGETRLLRYEAGHREVSHNASVAGEKKVGRGTLNTTRTGASAGALDGLVAADAERSVTSIGGYDANGSEAVDGSAIGTGAGVSADARRASAAADPVDEILAMLGEPAGPAREALANATAVALVPLGETIRVVSLRANGTFVYGDVTDRAPIAGALASVCMEQQAVGGVPGTPFGTINEAASTAFGLAVFAACIPGGVPIPVFLFLASPAVLYPIAHDTAFALLDDGGGTAPSESGVAALAGSILRSLAPLSGIDPAVEDAYEQAASLAAETAADLDETYATGIAEARVLYGDAAVGFTEAFAQAEGVLRDDLGVDPADTWVTIAPQARNPQVALWVLHPPTREADLILARGWSATDRVHDDATTISDANDGPDAGFDNPTEIPDVPTHQRRQ